MTHVYKCSFEDCFSELITFDTVNNDGKKDITYLNKNFIDKYKLFTHPKGSKETDNVEFLVTASFWEFDNIGVSRSIESLKLEDDTQYTLTFNKAEYLLKAATKYLICGECDKGPLGVIVDVEEINNPENKRQLCLLSAAAVLVN
ncbi:uncharacterized protein HGUI_00316 [Hanseniaspora guilliermondii]|uniref:Protein DSS4 n=1 Tax=Hanseniaspora guilliermondii TaxID=56406 RepID=A0A1L0AX09_9ASCO|nr:uncharacterized protein HGUI_00316 [Hanseniaspora guilliermondii]